MLLINRNSFIFDPLKIKNNFIFAAFAGVSGSYQTMRFCGSVFGEPKDYQNIPLFPVNLKLGMVGFDLDNEVTARILNVCCTTK